MIRPQTLRWRMIFLFCAAVGFMIISSYLGFLLFLAYNVSNQFDRQLVETAGPVITDLIANPEKQSVSRLDLTDQYFEVIAFDGHVQQTSKNLHGRALDLGIVNLGTTKALFRIVDRGGTRLRIALIPYRVGNDAYLLVLGVPNREAYEVVETFGVIIAILLPLNLVLIAWLSTWYVKRSLAPITALTYHARRMTESFRSDQNEPWSALPVGRQDDELGHLSETFNQLFSQIHTVVHQLRQFVTDASHELRTPLSVLRGETELILSQTRSIAEYERTLHVIDGELKRLTRIVEGLFTLSMADAGQLQLLREPVYISDILEEACAQAAPRARTKNINILRDFKAEIAYEGDEAFLRQLFLVFMDNAIKYSPAGTSVHVLLEKEGQTARIQFHDEGVGISEAELGHIFERFYRAAPRSGGDSHSGGLGLAIAQAIVRAHGGSISCQSVVGCGSVFSVTLPLSRTDGSTVPVSWPLEAERSRR